MRTAISYDQCERVCRMYHTNTDAARALGVSVDVLKAAAQRHGILVPNKRNKRTHS